MGWAARGFWRVKRSRSHLHGSDPAEFEQFDTAVLEPRDRYQLLTSLVVPRPIGWLSTVSPNRIPNLAPFSYFGALASDPMLVGVSIGFRSDGKPKDSLRNIRDTRAFCVNVVTLSQLDAMNATSVSLPPDDSEFEHGEVPLAWSAPGGIPFVADCPAVLECRLTKEVDLEGAPNALVIGEVVRVRLARGIRSSTGFSIDPSRLPTVGRLGGSYYAAPGDILDLGRP